MPNPSLSLQPSEAVVIRCASNIYSAYIAAGKIPTGHEREWMQRAIDEAIWIARTVDDKVRSDNEMS